MRYALFALLPLVLAGRLIADSTPVLPESLGPVPEGLGVNIHFTHPQAGEMEMLATAGFKWVRMDFGWTGIEREKGQYDFAEYDHLMDALESRHVRPVFILDYSNRLYDDNQSPHTDEGREAFAKWAAASVTHFKGRGVVWEMYNEPNIGFWRPKPNVDDYAKLALAVGKAIRQADPEALYIGPACSTMDFKFLEACFKAGCLEYWAAVSVHPYRQKPPETVVPDYQRLRELIEKYAPKNKPIPIVSGEWGYSSGWKNFDEQKQGKYLPRELLTNLANGVAISIWYDWHDDGENPKEPEHHFGTVHHPYRAGQDPVYEPKPAYLAMKTLSTELQGATFARRLFVGDDSDWLLLFRTSRGERLVAWTTGEKHDMHLPGVTGKFTVTGQSGEDLPEAFATQKGLTIRLTDAAQYFTSSDIGSKFD